MARAVRQRVGARVHRGCERKAAGSRRGLATTCWVVDLLPAVVRAVQVVWRKAPGRDAEAQALTRRRHLRPRPRRRRGCFCCFYGRSHGAIGRCRLLLCLLLLLLLLLLRLLLLLLRLQQLQRA